MSELKARAARTLQCENWLFINTRLQAGVGRRGGIREPLQRFLGLRSGSVPLTNEKPLKRFQNLSKHFCTPLKVGVNEKSVEITCFFTGLQPPRSFLFHVS